ncbi:MAG: exodeoxyribonuclease VII large subunit [Chlamydiota bacterium]
MKKNFPPQPRILTISQITHLVKQQLEGSFSNIALQGEISNFKRQSSGHLYFSLKDNAAQISAVMFRSSAQQLATLPKAGDQVIVQGALNVYPPHGKYQIVVQELFHVGLGQHWQRFEELKKDLRQRGWFNPEHKKELPHLPKRIGVITSPTGSVIQDILNVLNRRFSDFHLTLNPVKVQGPEASKEIAQAIEQFNRYQLADVIIVGRGGGSIEDLWAFNEELTARAIFESQIPIISAVGHETDYCIADFVADLRAPTPSAAAEIAMAEKAQQEKNLQQVQRRLQQSLQQIIRHDRQRLAAITGHPFFTNTDYLLGTYFQRVDDFRHNIDEAIFNFIDTEKAKIQASQKHLIALKPQAQLSYYSNKLCQLKSSLNTAINHLIASRQEKLAAVSNTLQALNPRNVLQKGYSIIFSEKENSVIFSTENVNKGDKLKIHLFDGDIKAVANEVTTND